MYYNYTVIVLVATLLVVEYNVVIAVLFIVPLKPYLSAVCTN